MATNSGFEITRREILAGLGTIGVASAGAGLGTTAYFSDSENFADNSLTAGQLDLKMDWQEHYSDWSADEEQYAGMGTAEDFDYELPGGDVGDSIYLSFHDDVENAQQKFMATTALEAYPDGDNDGINDYSDLEGVLDDPVAADPGDICDIGADTPEDLDPTTGLRTDNDDTYDTEAEAYKPLVALDDVKPGDYGEVTFSLHLCDNPGYLWMYADAVAWNEGGVTEPEGEDDDETGPADESGSTADGDSLEDATVELLDAIQTRVWYDGSEGTDSVESSGNNLKEDTESLVGEGKADVPTLQGSLRDVLGYLNVDPGVPLDASRFCASHIILDVDLSDVTTDEVQYKCHKSTDQQPRCEDFFEEDAIDAAPRWDFDEESFGGIDSTTTLSRTIDGADYTVEVTVKSLDGGNPNIIELNNITCDGNPAYAAAVIVKGGNLGNVCVPHPDGENHPSSNPLGDDNGAFTAPTTLGDNPNPGISFLELCIIEGEGQGGGGGTQNGGPRDCLVNSTTAYLGFEWWLPVDHANEIQTDSVSFDLGFYTEQCRHNDGSGMSREQ
jgi:predicted ribosomally synthesized peptide with SipW-like signal peptide